MANNLREGDLTIEVREVGGTALRLDWRGKSNARQPSAVLAPFFERLTKQATAGGRSIEMHFETIEHFNSSTITALIQLIQRLRNEKLKLVLTYDPGLKWQKLSFDALRVFEKPGGFLEIREERKS